MDTLAHSWPWVLCKFALSPVSLLAQTLCKVSKDEEQVLGTPDRAHFHQEGRGPPSIERRVLCIQAGLLSHCPETPAWICAKGSQHALP